MCASNHPVDFCCYRPQMDSSADINRVTACANQVLGKSVRVLLLPSKLLCPTPNQRSAHSDAEAAARQLQACTVAVRDPVSHALPFCLHTRTHPSNNPATTVYPPGYMGSPEPPSTVTMQPAIYRTPNSPPQPQLLYTHPMHTWVCGVARASQHCLQTQEVLLALGAGVPGGKTHT